MRLLLDFSFILFTLVLPFRGVGFLKNPREYTPTYIIFFLENIIFNYPCILQFLVNIKLSFLFKINPISLIKRFGILDY